MIDKRIFHYFLNEAKDKHPTQIGLIEAIQEEFEETVDPISQEEVRALKQYPIQYVKRVTQNKGEWTSQLHIWAEQCVPEILDLDPIYLSYKNSAGDSVLMSFVLGCTGAYTEKVDHKSLDKILNIDLSYEDIEKGDDGIETIVIQNALDEKDLNNHTVIDYLIDFAYGIGQFDNQETDEKLQEMIKSFAEKEGAREAEKENQEQELEEREDSKEEDIESPEEQNTTTEEVEEDEKEDEKESISDKKEFPELS